MIKGFVKDAIKYLPAQIIPAIVGLISISVITRLFPPEDYGAYSLVMVTVVVLTTLLGWLPVSIIRFYPAYERDNKLDSFYGNICSLTIISIITISLISLFLLVSIKTRVSPTFCLLMYIGIGLFAVIGLFDVLQYFLRSERKVNWYSRFAVWKSIGTLGIALLLIFVFRRGIESFLWGAILCVIIILPL
ncbi:MAG: oligosaccharide flippase family protein, partial [Thermoplasmata archaeon]